MVTLAHVLATSRKPLPPPHSIAPAEICTQMDGQPSYWVVLTTTKHSNSFARASARFALAAPIMCLLALHGALWVSEIFPHHFSACLLHILCFLAGSAYVRPGIKMRTGAKWWLATSILGSFSTSLPCGRLCHRAATSASLRFTFSCFLIFIAFFQHCAKRVASGSLEPSKTKVVRVL